MTVAAAAPASSRPARLVVVSDQADDSDETAFFLSLMGSLASDLPAELSFLLFSGGPSLEKFRAIAPTTVVRDLERESREALVERVCFALRLRRMGYARRARRLGLGPWQPGDVVYLHTVMALQVLRYLPIAAPTVLCHLGRSTPPLRNILRRRDRALVTRRVDRFLVDDPDMRLLLENRYRVEPARVRPFPDYFESVDGGPAATRPGVAARREALGIDPDAFLVGAFQTLAGSGSESLALFAALLDKRLPDHDFEILAIAPDDATRSWFSHDVLRAGISERVHLALMFPDHQDRSMSDPSPFVDLCDLVVLWALDEAKLPYSYEQEIRRGTPVACFAWSPVAELAGGTEGGLVLSEVDLPELASRVAALVADPDRYRDARRTVIAAVDAHYGPAPAARFVRSELAGAAGWESR